MPFAALDWIDDELAQLERQHLLREHTIRGGKQGAHIVLDGQRYINFGSNDYLGLAAHEPIHDAVRHSILHGGWGSGSSPLITARSSQQAELERHLAAFEQTEAALVFPSGFAANMGTLTCLAGRGDVVFSDAKNHASLIDGCRLTRAKIQVYPHCDVDALQQQLEQTPTARRRLIVTDGLFSMDGDLAPLQRLVQLAETYQAILVVDEAHATGVLAANGRGVCELLGVEDAVPVRTGTFSKAVGSVGGFVIGSNRLIQWIANRARPYVFSTAQPAASCAASLAGLKTIRDEPQRRRLLLHHADQLREAVRQLGWHLPRDNPCQIVPVMIGQPDQAMLRSLELCAAGLLVPAIRPPSVPVDESLLRISLTSDHTESDIGQLVGELAKIAV